MRTINLLMSAALLTMPTAFGSIIVYDATLNGSMGSGSAATGTAMVTIDTTANTMAVDLAFSGLTSGTTAAHIHCCTSAPGTGTAAPATPLPYFPGFPIGVTSGTYSDLFDLTSTSAYNSAFISASGGTAADAETALLAGMAAGDAYVNIHTTNFPGGEISGFLANVPEPGTFLLAGLVLAGFLLRRLLPRLA